MRFFCLSRTLFIVLLWVSPHYGQHGHINGHLIVSSYLVTHVETDLAREIAANPLAELPDVPVLTLGLVEADYVDAMKDEFQLNFTYTMIPPSDILAVGTMMENGTWTGAMGQLQRKEVEVVLSLVTMTPLKYSVADPSIPMYFEETVIVIPYAKHQSSINILSPLSPWTWVVLFFSMIVGSVLMIIAQRHLPHTKSFWVLAMVSTLASVEVSYFGMPNRTNTRLLLTAYLFGLFLLRNYYTAEFTSMLTIPNRVFAFESIEDVARQSHKVTVLVPKGSTDEEFIMTSDNPSMKRLANQLRRHPERLFRYDTELKAVYERVNDHTVLIQPKLLAQSMIYDDYMANDRKCRLTIAPKPFNPKAQGLAFPKGSSISDDFTGEILDQLRFGTLDFNRKNVLNTKREPCTKLKEGAPSDVLYMTNIAGAFYLLVLGLSLATFVFLCELIVFYWNQGDVIIVETKEAAVSHHCTSSNADEAVDEPREDHSSTPVSHTVRPTYLD